ncbi:uncharacterized protein LOC129590116 isoform X1 [Paramacrobiotus metropolitanus]|uniref:uncharacterized protein LOC129590116 isoform X1 n=1 Tax=Paramacrobiotus metropolitanus TaxID=2943436 RepID=UPI002445E5D6|nr:uncharacterized protein LOC129590116 isoform X1 [Paramacrobiotus metropolitanus]XP_055341113.1 uncharacterized protein LOC129590116 isoform X1 [Paramacrobiotus metropolitanus]XP_055341114.1 uncharacterized protein LOC129590116 isoform X1 [Paramacrobiotus metropolitanus]
MQPLPVCSALFPNPSNYLHSSQWLSPRTLIPVETKHYETHYVRQQYGPVFGSSHGAYRTSEPPPVNSCRPAMFPVVNQLVSQNRNVQQQPTQFSSGVTSNHFGIRCPVIQSRLPQQSSPYPYGAAQCPMYRPAPHQPNRRFTDHHLQFRSRFSVTTLCRAEQHPVVNVVDKPASGPSTPEAKLYCHNKETYYTFPETRDRPEITVTEPVWFQFSELLGVLGLVNPERTIISYDLNYGVETELECPEKIAAMQNLVSNFRELYYSEHELEVIEATDQCVHNLLSSGPIPYSVFRNTLLQLMDTSKRKYRQTNDELRMTDHHDEITASHNHYLDVLRHEVMKIRKRRKRNPLDEAKKYDTTKKYDEFAISKEDILFRKAVKKCMKSDGRRAYRHERLRRLKHAQRKLILSKGSLLSPKRSNSDFTCDGRVEKDSLTADVLATDLVSCCPSFSKPHAVRTSDVFVRRKRIRPPTCVDKNRSSKRSSPNYSEPPSCWDEISSVETTSSDCNFGNTDKEIPLPHNFITEHQSLPLSPIPNELLDNAVPGTLALTGNVCAGHTEARTQKEKINRHQAVPLVQYRPEPKPNNRDIVSNHRTIAQKEMGKKTTQKQPAIKKLPPKNVVKGKNKKKAQPAEANKKERNAKKEMRWLCCDDCCCR